MLSYYCSNNVLFSAQSEAHIAPTEKWITAQVSINSALGDSRWLLVQESSDAGVKILYSAVISAGVKLALDEDNLLIILRRPRTTPAEINEYKLKFETRLDFWVCLFMYTTARKRGTKQSGSLNSTTHHPMPALTETLGEAAPIGPLVLPQQGVRVEPAGQEGMTGQMFHHPDLYALLGAQ